MMMVLASRWCGSGDRGCGVLILQPMLLVGLLLVGGTSASPAEDASAMASPIQYLEPSLAASAAQGTTVAVSCASQQQHQQHEACVVLLTRSPQPVSSSRDYLVRNNKQEDDDDIATSSSTTESSSTTREMWGLRLVSDDDGSSTLQQQQQQQRWTRLGSSAVCAMTGFLPDIQHLTRVACRYAESQASLYAGQAYRSSTSKLVRFIANRLDREARAEGGRPLGLQVLLVGLDGEERNNFHPLLLYTLDPTGGWRHYCLEDATAVVGRHAEEVQQWLATHKTTMKSNDDTTRTPQQAALMMAMHALLHGADLQRSSSFKKDTARYDALLVWTTSTKGTSPCRLRMATIHRDTVMECHRACRLEQQEP